MEIVERNGSKPLTGKEAPPNKDQPSKLEDKQGSAFGKAPFVCHTLSPLA